jgi:hypothetical protein
MTYLASPGRIIRTYTSRSNAAGEIQFEANEFWGSREVIAQPNLLYDSARQITIYNPYSNERTSNRLPPFFLQSAIR